MHSRDKLVLILFIFGYDFCSGQAVTRGPNLFLGIGTQGPNFLNNQIAGQNRPTQPIKFVTPRPNRPAFNPIGLYASIWAAWSHWSHCVDDRLMRVRACNRVRGFRCFGSNKQFRPCDETQLVREIKRPVQFFGPSTQPPDYDPEVPWAEDRRIAMEQLFGKSSSTTTTRPLRARPRVRTRLVKPFKGEFAGIQSNPIELTAPGTVQRFNQPGFRPNPPSIRPQPPFVLPDDIRQAQPKYSFGKPVPQSNVISKHEQHTVKIDDNTYVIVVPPDGQFSNGRLAPDQKQLRYGSPAVQPNNYNEAGAPSIPFGPPGVESPINNIDGAAPGIPFGPPGIETSANYGAPAIKPTGYNQGSVGGAPGIPFGPPGIETSANYGAPAIKPTGYNQGSVGGAPGIPFGPPGVAPSGSYGAPAIKPTGYNQGAAGGAPGIPFGPPGAESTGNYQQPAIRPNGYNAGIGAPGIPFAPPGTGFTGGYQQNKGGYGQRLQPPRGYGPSPQLNYGGGGFQNQPQPGAPGISFGPPGMVAVGQGTHGIPIIPWKPKQTFSSAQLSLIGQPSFPFVIPPYTLPEGSGFNPLAGLPPGFEDNPTPPLVDTDSSEVTNSSSSEQSTEKREVSFGPPSIKPQPSPIVSNLVPIPPPRQLGRSYGRTVFQPQSNFGAPAIPFRQPGRIGLLPTRFGEQQQQQQPWLGAPIPHTQPNYGPVGPPRYTNSNSYGTGNQRYGSLVVQPHGYGGSGAPSVPFGPPGIESVSQQYKPPAIQPPLAPGLPFGPPGVESNGYGSPGVKPDPYGASTGYESGAPGIKFGPPGIEPNGYGSPNTFSESQAPGIPFGPPGTGTTGGGYGSPSIIPNGIPEAGAPAIPFGPPGLESGGNGYGSASNQDYQPKVEVISQNGQRTVKINGYVVVLPPENELDAGAPSIKFGPPGTESGSQGYGSDGSPGIEPGAPGIKFGPPGTESSGDGYGSDGSPGIEPGAPGIKFGPPGTESSGDGYGSDGSPGIEPGAPGIKFGPPGTESSGDGYGSTDEPFNFGPPMFVDRFTDRAQWSHWGFWSDCKCATKSRSRNCNFATSYLTQGCRGKSYEINSCSGTPPCVTIPPPGSQYAHERNYGGYVANEPKTYPLVRNRYGTRKLKLAHVIASRLLNQGYWGSFDVGGLQPDFDGRPLERFEPPAAVPRNSVPISPTAGFPGPVRRTRLGRVPGPDQPSPTIGRPPSPVPPRSVGPELSPTSPGQSPGPSPATGFGRAAGPAGPPPDFDGRPVFGPPGSFGSPGSSPLR